MEALPYSQQKRADQHAIAPTAIGSRQIASEFVTNTPTDIVAFSGLSDGAQITVTSTTTASANPGIPLGAVPYTCLFFLSTVEDASLIPHGSGITPDAFVVMGPHHIPPITGVTTASDGKNLVHKTTMLNISGGAASGYFVVSCRVILGVGGGGTS